MNKRVPSTYCPRTRIEIASLSLKPALVIGVRSLSSKPVGAGAVFQRLIPTGERSGLLTHIAATENVLSCARMKS